MAKAPSFQWYPKDCDTDENVRAMHDEEFGFYMRCLNHSWLNEGLPGDLLELARIMGRTPAYVRRVWVRVGRCFELRDGRFVNPKQEIQRESVRTFVESRKKNADARWGKHKQCTADARASIMQCSPSASASPVFVTQTPDSVLGVVSPGPIRTTAADLNGSTSQRFPEWWEIWSAVRGTHKKTAACQAFVSVVTVELENSCFQCTASYLAGLQDRTRGFNPDNFLFEQAKDRFEARWPVRTLTRAEALDRLTSGPAPNMYPDADDWKKNIDMEELKREREGPAKQSGK